MANNKYYGYSPKKETTVPSTGVTSVGTRLDRVNPYEFRKGMDVELTSLGVSRLAESTPEEREKVTEIVLKNLEEHQAYYSALIQYKTGMNQGGPINETSFKKYLETYTSKRGEGMVEVNTEIKDDKMTEPKYDKSIYTLKEAIKTEIKNILSEEEDKEPSKKQVKKDKKAMSLAKTKETLLNKKKDKEALEDKRKEAFEAYKDKIKNLDPKQAKKEFDRYKKKEAPITAKIKDIDAEIKALDKTLEEAKKAEKEMRYEVAKTMMPKEVHMEMLKMMKELGVPMTETAGVKMYYEVAKMAYMEGLTAGMKKNI
jgi:chromosome segregation ATPase